MFKSIGNIIHLIKHQTILEFKSPFVIGANLLYVISAVFITYKVFNELSPPSWVAVFWLIFLFISMNTTLHSFSREQSQSILFYYSIMQPIELFFSRLIFNLIFLLASMALLYGCMKVFLTDPIEDYPLMIKTVLLAGLGFAINFTFTSAIAIHTRQSSTIMAILSLPLIIPIIITAVKLSLVAANIIIDDGSETDLMIIGAIDMIMLGAVILLFPSLWRS